MSENTGAGNVVAFLAASRRVEPLTDEEIERLRSLLDHFQAIATACPIARNIVERLRAD